MLPGIIQQLGSLIKGLDSGLLRRAISPPIDNLLIYRLLRRGYNL